MRTATLLTAIACYVAGWAQLPTAAFSLEQKHDSLYMLTLTTDSTCDRWTLPHPVYRMTTGDVDGDGSEDAVVGVIKPTRFHPEQGRRLFIFKNYHGLVRPLWLGSKLGGKLCDFRFCNGRVRSLEATDNGLYVVAEYRWSGFGFAFDRYIGKGVTRKEALTLLEHN